MEEEEASEVVPSRRTRKCSVCGWGRRDQGIREERSVEARVIQQRAGRVQWPISRCPSSKCGKSQGGVYGCSCGKCTSDKRLHLAVYVTRSELFEHCLSKRGNTVINGFLLDGISAYRNNLSI